MPIPGRSSTAFNTYGEHHYADNRRQRGKLTKRAQVRSRLADLLPESRVTRGQQRIFSRIPSQEVVGLGVCGVMLSRLPNLMQQKRSRPLNRTVQIVTHAPFFF